MVNINGLGSVTNLGLGAGTGTPTGLEGQPGRPTINSITHSLDPSIVSPGAAAGAQALANISGPVPGSFSQALGIPGIDGHIAAQNAVNGVGTALQPSTLAGLQGGNSLGFQLGIPGIDGQLAALNAPGGTLNPELMAQLASGNIPA